MGASSTATPQRRSRGRATRPASTWPGRWPTGTRTAQLADWPRRGSTSGLILARDGHPDEAGHLGVLAADSGGLVESNRWRSPSWTTRSPAPATCPRSPSCTSGCGTPVRRRSSGLHRCLGSPDIEPGWSRERGYRARDAGAKTFERALLLRCARGQPRGDRPSRRARS